MASAVLLPVLLAATMGSASAQVVVQSTSGVSTYQPSANFFIGWSFTTPSGGPWNNIKVTLYDTPANGSTPASGPLALGSVWLFTQPFSGTPADLASSPLLVAYSTSQASGSYVFPASVALNPNTQYWIYENGPYPLVSYSNGGGGSAVISNGPTAPFAPPPASLNFGLPNFIIGGTVAAGLPSITTIANAASNIGAGFPNSGIAQGAIFIVQGNNLGPANLSIASAAFQSDALSHTSVAIDTAGTEVNALMYYTSTGQIAALLPSSTPAGQGSLTVSYNGSTSGAVPITVVANNLGIFTVDSSGGGPGIVTYGDYSLVSPVKAANCGGPYTTCGAANPNDTLILWATGLGPVNGSDASGAGLGQNMPQIPLTVWLGGVQAPVSYQGRSGCCIGEDQIVFTVPPNTPTGCAVPLVIQIGGVTSNTTLMPVASGSRNCTPASPAFSSLGSPQIEQEVMAGPITYGNITLAHYSEGGGDNAKFQLLNITSFASGTQPFIAEWIDDQPNGTCVTYANLNAGFNAPVAGATQLNPGSSFTVTGPSGSVTLPVDSGNFDEFNMAGSFLVPGAYTVTGSGGSVVAPITASISIPAAATMTSPSNNGSATRANGLTISWTGGAGTLQIEVNSCSTPACNSGASALCTVPASLGTFTIPSYVLEALPAGNSAGVVLSSFSDASFSAAGLDSGAIYAYSNVSGFGYGWGSGNFALQ